MDDWLETNRTAWDAQVAVHLDSPFYDVAAFRAGACALNALEVKALGDMTGRSLLHLQCHFGLDTLSWARRGARVTGVDFSGKAIEAARALAADTGLEARFLQSDVYRVGEVLTETFDVVFTSYGVIGWLPDLERWADIVVAAMRPGGTFFLAEFHPAMWMLDKAMERVAYPYFNTDAPIIEEVEGTYADREAALRTRVVSWNHSLAEVIGVLLARGLVLEALGEHPFSYYNCLEGLEQREDGTWWRTEKPGWVPLMYHLVARRPE